MSGSPTKFDIIAKRLEAIDLRLAAQGKDPSPNPVESTVRWRRRPAERDIKHSTSPVGVERQLTKSDTAPEIAPQYDLAECIKLQDVESYWAIAVDRHVELIMKNGWDLQGKDPGTLRYVRRRLREVSLVSRQPFSDMIRELVRNIVVTSNGYWVLSRDETRSSGRKTRMWGKIRDPISGISIPDPSSVTMKQTKSGNPISYKQTIPGMPKRTWSYHDVIHIPWRKKSGWAFGTPTVIPALEDIRALRKLEMLAEHVSHKFVFPLMHWRVGTEKVPADMVVDQATGLKVAEVDIANKYAEILAQEGYVVTSERHEIKIVGAEGAVLDIEKYIEHYELRVLAGLRLSQLDLGRGDTANRGTAKVLSQILADACKEIQDVICNYLNDYFFFQLLMEGGFNVTEENLVELVFPAIDTEEERAHQNHWAQLYVLGLCTREEARREGLHLEDIPDAQEQNLYLNEHLIPLATAEAKAKALASPGGQGGSTATSAASKKNAKSSGNRAQPANQSGKASTKKKIASNDVLAAWNRAAQSVMSRAGSQTERDVRPVFTQAQRAIYDMVHDPILEEFYEGFDSVHEEAGLGGVAREYVDLHQVKELLQNVRNRDLQQVSATCMLSAGINPATTLPRESAYADGLVIPAFQSSGFLLDSRLGRAHRAARVLGYLQGARAMNKDKVFIRDAKGRDYALELTDELNDHQLRCFAMNPELQSSTVSVVEIPNEISDETASVEEHADE